jgi:hypothetical protein
MTANDWVAIAVGVCAVCSTLFMGLRWVIKSYLAELKPNGGSSIKDTISRLELQSSRLEQRVDDLFILISKQ